MKILIPATPVHPFALQRPQSLRTATAYVLRRMVSSKRLALALDVDHSTAWRIRHGEVGNPWELAAVWAEALEAMGHDTTDLLEILTDAAERGRAAYLDTHPWQRSA